MPNLDADTQGMYERRLKERLSFHAVGFMGTLPKILSFKPDRITLRLVRGSLRAMLDLVNMLMEVQSGDITKRTLDEMMTGAYEEETEDGVCEEAQKVPDHETNQV